MGTLINFAFNVAAGTVLMLGAIRYARNKAWPMFWWGFAAITLVTIGHLVVGSVYPPT